MKRLLVVLGAGLFIVSGVALRIALPRRALAATTVSDGGAPEGSRLSFGPRALTVVEDEGNDQPLLRVSARDLPAVSEDGQIVTLENDTQDFSGESFLTLRFVSARAGVVASYELAAPHLTLATQRERIEAGQTRLASTRWRTLERATILGGRYEDVKIDFPRAGVSIRIPKAERDHLQFEGALWQERRIPLPPMGFLRFKPIGPCGAVEGYADAYLDPGLGTLLLAPDATLGGDECMGELGIERLIVVGLH